MRKAILVLVAASMGGCFYGTDQQGRSGPGYDDPARPVPQNAVMIGLPVVLWTVGYERAVTPVQSLGIRTVWEVLSERPEFLYGTAEWRYYATGTAPLGVFVGVGLGIAGAYFSGSSSSTLPEVFVGVKGMESRGTTQGIVFEARIGMFVAEGLFFLPNLGLSAGLAF